MLLHDSKPEIRQRSRPAEQLPLESWSYGELVDEHPTICQTCAGLCGHVSFGFENAWRAWDTARQTLIATVLNK
jgi:hypothetical protein